MITVFSGANTKYKALSSDRRPKNCRNGDRLKEIDTGTLLIYDEENSQWCVFASATDPTSNLVGTGRVGYMEL